MLKSIVKDFYGTRRYGYKLVGYWLLLLLEFDVLLLI